MAAIWLAVLALVVLLTPGAASAQTLGTFRWQLQPYCNVVTATVTQSGGVFTLDGYDDQCGNGERAAVAGTAFPNPNGSIGIGFTIVTAPAGTPVHVDVALNLATLGGRWRDSTGASGNFVFNPTARSGSARPVPNPAAFPTFVAGQTTFSPDGGFVARGTNNVGAVPASGAGIRAMWFPGRSAFRAGEVTADQWDSGAIGRYSVAFGLDTRANGILSSAFGDSSNASGQISFAGGQNTRARGDYSVAFGAATTASGVASFAMGTSVVVSGNVSAGFGQETKASGPFSIVAGINSIAGGIGSTAFGRNAQAMGAGSFAVGSNLLADGNQSLVLGSGVQTTGAGYGSFIFGDASGIFTTVSAANQFIARAHGGFDFITASTPEYKGCQIAAPAGRLSCTGGVAGSSDRRRKQDIVPLDGEDVLARIATLPVATWSFIDTPSVRHAGPMAQDFHAAFGLGDGDTTINYTDINGINMRAIQALEARTRAATTENEELRDTLAALQQRLDRLEHGAVVQATAIDPDVLVLREKAWRAWFAGDATYLRTILPAEFIGLGFDGGPPRSLVETLGDAATFVKNGGKLVSLAFHDNRHQRYGDLVILYSRYELVLENNGQKTATTGRATEVFVRRDNRWWHPAWHLDRK